MTPRPPLSTLFPYTTLFRSLFYCVAHLFMQDEAYGVVNHVFFLAATAAQDEAGNADLLALHGGNVADRKSTRLNSCHQIISHAVFCLKKKTKRYMRRT